MKGKMCDLLVQIAYVEYNHCVLHTHINQIKEIINVYLRYLLSITTHRWTSLTRIKRKLQEANTMHKYFPRSIQKHIV